MAPNSSYAFLVSSARPGTPIVLFTTGTANNRSDCGWSLELLRRRSYELPLCCDRQDQVSFRTHADQVAFARHRRPRISRLEQSARQLFVNQASKGAPRRRRGFTTPFSATRVFQRVAPSSPWDSERASELRQSRRPPCSSNLSLITKPCGLDPRGEACRQHRATVSGQSGQATGAPCPPTP